MKSSAIFFISLSAAVVCIALGDVSSPCGDKANEPALARGVSDRAFCPAYDYDTQCTLSAGSRLFKYSEGGDSFRTAKCSDSSASFREDREARSEPDSSGMAPCIEPREWKDEAGRVVKRVDASGRMFLLTWDESGRLIRIAGVAGRVKPGTPEGTVPEGGLAWVHCFIYGDAGLIAEVDCRGERHDFAEPPALDLKAGTALRGHPHPNASSSRGAAPARPAARKFTYDDRNRLTSVEKE